METQPTPPQLPSCRTGSTHNDSDGKPHHESQVGKHGLLTPVSDLLTPSSSRSSTVVEDVHNASQPPARDLRHAAKRQLDKFTSIFSREDDHITNAPVKSSETDLSDDEKPRPPTDQKQQDGPSEPPYHVFTTRKKWELVYIVSLAGLFSPLSSNIYFPALGDIAEDTETDIALIALTVTVYMLVQGVAPSFWGPLSDTRGRRITFIGTFAVYLVANIALVFSDEFEMLMVFRAIQAAGSAATISVGAGVIGDITTAKERGGFMGSFGGIRMLGQAVGPVIGGIVTQFFGFHAIFWLLFIMGSVALILIVLFLPETLRRIAGNGSVPLEGLNRPIIYQPLKQYWEDKPHPEQASQEDPPRVTLGSILSPLRFLFEKDVFCTLLFGAVVYTIWSTVTSSTTALFQPRYGLSDLEVGLAFLPNGAGCIAGSCITGRILDRDYSIVEAQYRAARGLPADAEVGGKKTADFPVSRARLRSAWYQVVLFVLAVGGYGFSVDSPLLASVEGMAVPLVLQFVIAFTATGLFTQNSALMVDLYPGASASATAVNNLIRCALGAAGVAAVQFIIDGIGEVATFLAFAGLTVGLTPLLWLVWVYGDQWRMARVERLGREEREAKCADGGEGGKDGGMQ
ncbi:major facilitator superfamily domain-containing protein [Chaetomium tenue]|uniref:Major facilitator superfamily domain-containing protein n=1 Tax=Chaetomium tenue TaxID=1854479 RepID=A0ACB7PTD8_9PEZI|nr:major facilitator superfamily domain-containing protein [Chaetomium globosum]